MTISKEKAIQEYRKMWEWIAKETKKRKRKVEKSEYTESHKLSILYDCWLCEFVEEVPEKCDDCPILFAETKTNVYLNFCEQKTSLYRQWTELGDKDWKEAAKLALAIAELPEKTEKKEEEDVNRTETKQRKKRTVQQQDS